MVGDIVLAPFPYTDLSQATIRPALVLADVNMSDCVLCQITSSAQARPRDIAIDPDDLQFGRLTVGSHVRPERLVTLNSSIFRRTIGRLTDAKLAEIAAAVRSLF